MRHAVSFIICNDKDEFLIIKRPESDKELGPVWGLPATNFDPRKESLDDAVVRGGVRSWDAP